MTAPLRGTLRASAVPASQNTAPVAEFRCLFTHDVRRKQKRWQDGYLKFHTFNNRVMVYDEARNFLGDTYYKESDALYEGDALNLDKGVMVEVAEAIGVTQTDLTPLFEKKTKESPVRLPPPSQPRPFQKPSLVAPTGASRPPSQLRHKSLNTLLGTPKGPVGKAVPMQSPYEARKGKENELVPDRAAKRQKVVHNTPSWRASSPVRDKSPAAKEDLPLWAKTSDAKNARISANIPPAAEVIELPSEPDPILTIMSDVTLPSTPPGLAKARTMSQAASKPIKPAVPRKVPVQTPKIPQKKAVVSNKKLLKTPKQSAPPSSPPVSASNRLTNVDVAVQPFHQARKEVSPLPDAPRNPKAKSLRLSVGVKRGTLFCQSLPQPAPRAGSESRASAVQPRYRQTSVLRNKEPSPAASHHSGAQSEKGITKASRKPTLLKGKRKGTTAREEIPSKRTKTSVSPPRGILDADDDPEVMHGIMDQQLLVLSSPVQPQVITSSPPAFEDPKPLSTVATRPAITNQNTRKRTSPEMLEPEPTKSKSLLLESMQPKARPQKTAMKKSQSIQTPSIIPAPVLEPPLSPQRDDSPAHTEASVAQSRTSSISPTKPALSTDGFRKKLKRAPKQPAVTTPAPETSAPDPAPCNITISLPPHPLRADRNGPFMDTTELAAILQQPKRSKKAGDKPTKNEVLGTGKSPNRSFRRVRSENDAPIPSTAEDWEKRNLPKPTDNPTENVDEPAITVAATNSLPPKKKANGLSALIKKTDPRRKFQRTQSLTVETNIPRAEETDVASPVVDEDVGPWSTEAFDLSDWRPPNRG